MLKSEIRNTMKMKRSSLTKEERLLQSRAIHKRLQDLEVYHNCNNLFSYLSFGTEVDTWDILSEFISDNHKKRRVYLPRVEGNDLNFYEMKELDTLKRSSFGVPEPDESHLTPWVIPSTKKDVRLMLMPGLAFDPVGNRIGYGAGYYDRYLRNYEEANFIKIALAYDFQIMAHIEADPYDIPMDYILTPERIIRCKQKADIL